MAGDEPRSDASNAPEFGDDDLERRVNLLIDRGLESYESGDLGAALSSWELALTLAPDHARVTEYINYVNTNYDALKAAFERGAQANAEVPSAPSGLQSRLSSVVDLDNDDYDEVEVVIGADDAADDAEDAPASTPPAAADDGDRPGMSAIDDGWGFDEVAALPPPPSKQKDGDFPDDDEAIREITQGLDLAANAAGSGSEAGDEPLELDAPPGDEPLEINAPPDESAGDPALVETADVDSKPDAFGAGFAVDRRPQRPLSFAARDDVDDDEITVPGGGEEPAPYRGDGVSLSADAIEAIDGGEKTREHPGKIGRGFGLRDIGPLDMRLIGDQLLEQAGRDAEIALQTAPGAKGAPAKPGDGDFAADDELTIERGAQKGGGRLGDDEATVDRGPPGGRSPLRLDSEPGMEEETVERRLPGDVGDDELTRERGRKGTPWAGPALDMPSLDVPTGPSSVIVDDSAFGSEPPTRRRGLDLDSREGDFSAAARGEFDDEQTVERVRVDSAAGSPRALSAPAIAQMAEAILEDLERDPPADESEDEHLRRRVTGLIKRAELESRLAQHATAIVALDLALDESPGSAVAQKVIHRHRDLLFDVFESYLGDMAAIPTLAIPIHELAGQDLDNRVAFLLTRADGSLCFEEILDVSGMTRLETYRHLCKMLLRGILEVR